MSSENVLGTEDLSTGIMILIGIVALVAVVMAVYSTTRPEVFEEDCQGEFSQWSPCEGPCGEIPKISRTYKITSPAANGGLECPHPDGFVETQTCQGEITPCCEIIEDWKRESETCPSSGVIATKRVLKENKPGACDGRITEGQELCCYEAEDWVAVGGCGDHQPGFQKYEQTITSKCPDDFAFEYRECRDCVGEYDISDDDFVCPTACGHPEQTITRTWSSDVTQLLTGRECPDESQSIDCDNTPPCPCEGYYTSSLSGDNTEYTKDGASCPTPSADCGTPASTFTWNQTDKDPSLTYKTCPDTISCDETTPCCEYNSEPYKYGTCGQYESGKQLYRKDKSNAPCIGPDLEEYASEFPCCEFQEMACSSYATEDECRSPCFWNNGACTDDACVMNTTEDDCTSPCEWDETTLACKKGQPDRIGIIDLMPDVEYAQPWGVCTFDETTETYSQVYRKQKANAPCESDVDHIDVTVKCAPCEGEWVSAPCPQACDTSASTPEKTWSTTTSAIGTGVCPSTTSCDTHTNKEDCELWCTWNSETQMCSVPTYECAKSADCCVYETEEEAVAAGRVDGVCTLDTETNTYYQKYIRQKTLTTPTPCEALPDSELVFTRECAPCVGKWESPACPSELGEPSSTPSQVWTTTKEAVGTGTCPNDPGAPPAPTYDCDSTEKIECKGDWDMTCPTGCGYDGGDTQTWEQSNKKEGKNYESCPTSQTCEATDPCTCEGDWDITCPTGCGYGGDDTQKWVQTNKTEGINYESCPASRTCEATDACEEEDYGVVGGVLTTIGGVATGAAAWCWLNPSSCINQTPKPPSLSSQAETPCAGYFDKVDMNCPTGCGEPAKDIKATFNVLYPAANGGAECSYNDGEEVTVKTCPATPACCKYDSNFSEPAITGVPGVCIGGEIKMQRNKRPADEQPPGCQDLPDSETKDYEPCQDCEGYWDSYAGGLPTCAAGLAQDTTYTRTWKTTTAQDSNGYGASCPSPTTESKTCYKTCTYGWVSDNNCTTTNGSTTHTETWKATNEPCEPNLMDS